MYLALLNEEKKKLFLDLSYCIASADGVYSDDEKLMISSYQQEMNNFYDPARSKKNVKDVIAALAKNCSKQEMKIIVFEAIGLAVVDGIYDDSEQAIIHLLTEVFQMDASFPDECEKIINEYKPF